MAAPQKSSSAVKAHERSEELEELRWRMDALLQQNAELQRRVDRNEDALTMPDARIHTLAWGKRPREDIEEVAPQSSKFVKLNGGEDSKTQASKAVKRTKDIPRFSGAANEDYGQWKHESKFYIQDMAVRDTQKVDILIIGLGGTPRNLVAKRTDLKSPNDLYAVLEKTYRRPGTEMQIALTSKQRDDESVRDFAGRVEANVTNAEIQGAGVAEILLSIFLGGVKPEYARRLNAWGPGTFETAVSSAIRYEDGAAPKKDLKPLYAITSNDKNKSWDCRERTETKPILTTSRFDARTPTETTSRFPSKVEREWEKVQCFHCGEKGHGFSRCERATAENKRAILSDLPNLVARKREQTGNTHTSLNMNSGPARDSQLNR